MNNPGETRDEWARDHEFLVLVPGEAYQRQVSRSGLVFLYQTDNGKWLVVYDNTWTDEKGRTYRKQQVKAGGKTADDGSHQVYGTTWDKAVEQAERFVRFMTNNRRRGA